MRLRNILPLVALLAVPAMAQDAHFGFQFGISSPGGGSTSYNTLSLKDAVDSSLGFTLGANVGVEWQGGHVLRPRLDYTHHSGSPSGSGLDVTVTNFQVGADYNYFVSGKAAQGFYFLVGLGYANTKLEASYLGSSASNNGSALAWGLGIGGQITPLTSVELRLNSTHPDLNGVTVNNDTLNLTVGFRF